MPAREAGKKLNQYYSAWKEQCPRSKNLPIRDVMSHIGDKWSAFILVNLSQRPYRFRELKRAIPNISQRVLAQTLKHLEQDGLVNRQVYPTNPPSVEYSLTALGESLLIPLWQLVDWTNVNYKKILSARERFIRLKN